MGWTTRFETVNSRSELKYLLDNLYAYNDTPNNWTKVLRSTIVGNVYYNVCEQCRDGVYDKFVGICPFSNSPAKGEWSYNLMEENEGPAYYKCPVSYFKISGKIDNECGKNWRKKCIEFSEAAQRMRKTVSFKKLKKGEVGILPPSKNWAGKYNACIVICNGLSYNGVIQSRMCYVFNTNDPSVKIVEECISCKRVKFAQTIIGDEAKEYVKNLGMSPCSLRSLGYATDAEVKNYLDSLIKK